MQADRGQNLREYGMLKGDFREAVPREQGVLIPDLNGINMTNIIHLNRFIFPVDETKLEAMHRAYLSWLVSLLYVCWYSKQVSWLSVCFF